MLLAAVAIRHDRLEPSTITGGNLNLDPRAHVAMVITPRTTIGTLLTASMHS
jgi:hypothetical protein